MIGEIVIVRCRDAGVHFGRLMMYQNRMVQLSGARRIWRWEGANTLNEVSQTGITGGRVSEPVPKIVLLDACEIIPASDAAIAKLEATGWSE